MKVLIVFGVMMVGVTLPLKASSPAEKITDPVVYIAAGFKHTCAILASGETWCWGYNSSGQLGNGAKSHRNIPARVDLLERASHIAAGYNHTCATTENGKVWCWGNGKEGKLGTGDLEPRVVPAEVMNLDNATHVAAGLSYSCAVSNLGEGYCWGSNANGALGTGDWEGRLTPSRVHRSANYRSISAPGFDGRHTCALTVDGTGYCWGKNRSGQMGIGSKGGDFEEPYGIKKAPLFSQLATASDSSCGLAKVDDSIWCWGSNEYGQLGAGALTGEDAVFPQARQISGTFSALAAGGDSTCAVDSKQNTYCWGRNDKGQLGDGSQKMSNVPVMVDIKARIVQIAVGYNHVCALDNVGQVYCWGDGEYGQLGHGIWVDKQLTPVKVQFP